MPGPQDLFADLPGRGITLHYRDWGGDGLPLILLHGLSSGARIWDFVAARLVPQFRVIAVDQRGHGLSDKPDDGYGFDAVTADLAALLDVLDLDSAALVGHSWGGNVALQFGTDYPGRVRGLILVDGGFIERPPEATWEDAEREMRPPDIDGVPVEQFVGFMKRWPALRDSWSDELQTMVLSNFEVREDGTIARRLSIPNHMKIARAIFDQRPSSLLPRVPGPVLLIPAAQEPSNDQERRWQERRREGVALVTEARPDVQVLWIEDTVHDVPVHRPAELAEAIAAFAGPLS